MFLIDSKNSLESFSASVVGEMECTSVGERFVAVDTEFMREGLEKPLLCLIQIATPSDIFLIDPIAVDIAPLKELFENPQIKKVFHSAFQDLEILSLYGIDTKNFYDTQLYESVASTSDSISYQSIVLRYLGKRLEKGHTLSDWKKRPLSEKQLAYSADDVFYLREVYKKQFQKLLELKRENWLDDELLQIAEKGKENYFVSTLDENNLAIYNQLNEFRQKRAVEKGVLPRSIAKNDVIKSICKKGADFVRHLKNSRSTTDRCDKGFLSFVEKIAERLEVKERPPERDVVFDLLKTFLEICSQKYNVAASAIATSKDLKKLIDGDDDAKCMSGWRSEIFGKDVRRLLNGEISLRIRESEVIAE